MDFPAEAATSNRQHRLDRICSKKNLRALTGANIGEEVLVPRIALNTTDVKWPFTLQRRQFPVRICYAMTINKSQGQTLSKVGLYLKKPVFTHGQLYVAVSRCTSRSGIKVLIENDDGTCGSETRNVVYTEVLMLLMQHQLRTYG